MANMLTKFIFDRMHIPDNKSFLDLTGLRHKLISGNIANVSTPGYRSQDIDFKKEFARATGQTSQLDGQLTNERHIPLGNNPARPPRVNDVKIKEGEMNSVDIDREISNLAQNELLFTIGARMLQRKFEGLRTAIRSKG